MSPEAKNCRRDRIIQAVCLVIFVVGGALVFHNVAMAQPAPPDAIEYKSKSAGDAVIGFGGDTLLADASEDVLHEQGYSYALEELIPIIGRHNDFLVNMEGPITLSTDQVRTGVKYAYAANPAAAQALADAGVNLAALGNNHIMDRGETGMADTIALLNDAEVSTFGAGINESEAERPLLITTDAGRIAVVNLGENYGAQVRATDTTPGMTRFTLGSVQRGVDAAKALDADLVVAYVHWGDNYQDINESQRYWAEQMALAGYDIIIGTGSHTAQPFEMVHGVPVIFDLGNFAFGTNGRFDSYGQPGVGLIATLQWPVGGEPELGVQCIMTDNSEVDFQPRACDSQLALETYERISPDHRVVGGVAWLPVR